MKSKQGLSYWGCFCDCFPRHSLQWVSLQNAHFHGQKTSKFYGITSVLVDQIEIVWIQRWGAQGFWTGGSRCVWGLAAKTLCKPASDSSAGEFSPEYTIIIMHLETLPLVWPRGSWLRSVQREQLEQEQQEQHGMTRHCSLQSQRSQFWKRQTCLQTSTVSLQALVDKQCLALQNKDRPGTPPGAYPA